MNINKAANFTYANSAISMCRISTMINVCCQHPSPLRISSDNKEQQKLDVRKHQLEKDEQSM